MNNERSLAKEITEGFKALKSMRNNEPVAWFEQDLDMKSIWYQSDQDNPNAIPLYTHPVKELTDEEIQKLAEYHGIDSLYETGRLDFAKAILRKAQEK